MAEDKTFRIVIDSKELRARLLKRVEFHQARMRHYMKKEAQELKDKLKKEKEAMQKDQERVEELDLVLAQERSSYQGIPGFSGFSGFSGLGGKAEFKHTVMIGHSEKFMMHERASRMLEFIANHLKGGVLELDQHEMHRLELV